MRLDFIRPRFVLLTLILAITLPAFSASAYVRINQIGYEVSQTSRAYLISTSSESGATFTVSNSGGTAYSGSVPASSGKWGSYYVYPLDFKVTTAGSYTLSVSGAVNATSPTFKVDTPANLYSSLLANTLSFYQNQRDGANYLASSLRTAPGHLNDKSAKVYKSPSYDSNDNLTKDLTATGATVNVDGGWWDAGDYLKFVQTASYTEALMLTGVRDFPSQMGAGSSASDFTAEAKFGLDWLQKMWNDSTQTLYYQVGIGACDSNNNICYSDHDIWRLPQDDDSYGGSDSSYRYIRSRPVFVAGSAGAKISPNLAGRLAADFAECYQVFQTTNTSYANQCLLAAEHVFDLANTSPSGDLLTVAPFDFYGETEWRDDLELGATELYFALATAKGTLPSGLPHTSSSYYLTQAANWAHAYITGPNDAADTLNLYDVSGLAHYELYRAITLAGNPSGLAVSQATLLADIKKQLDGAISQAGSDPFQFGYDWSAGDTATHGNGLVVMAREYYNLSGDGTYSTWARRWMSNMMGANSWGVSFIVGDGSNFTDCVSHQVANLAGSLSGGSPVLKGAVVEGSDSGAASGYISGMKNCPSSGDRFKAFNGNGAQFKDNMQSYVNTEPAIDLTASSMLMWAWKIAGAPAQNP